MKVRGGGLGEGVGSGFLAETALGGFSFFEIFAIKIKKNQDFFQKKSDNSGPSF